MKCPPVFCVGGQKSLYDDDDETVFGCHVILIYLFSAEVNLRQKS